MNGCPNDAPVELSDGTLVQPDDTIRLKDLCEIVPLILETMQAAAASAPGARGPVTPGAPVPVRGQMPGFNSPVAQGFGNKPGAIAPAQGLGRQGGGGGGGFGGGGGGRGAPGQKGDPGIQGLPGPGSFIGGQLKTSGSFTATGAPVVIPNYFVNFTVLATGNVLITASANFTRSPGSTFPQVTFGLQVDGVDFPLALFQEQQGAGSDQVFDAHLTVQLFIENMAPGPHVVRGIYSGGFPGAEMTFVAAPAMPAMLSVHHP
jgi:hypothetical protein